MVSMSGLIQKINCEKMGGWVKKTLWLFPLTSNCVSKFETIVLFMSIK